MDYIHGLITGINSINQVIADVDELKSNKQDKLISGENIKTLSGESILGEGDLKLYNHCVTITADTTSILISIINFSAEPITSASDSLNYSVFKAGVKSVSGASNKLIFITSITPSEINYYSFDSAETGTLDLTNATINDNVINL